MILIRMYQNTVYFTAHTGHKLINDGVQIGLLVSDWVQTDYFWTQFNVALKHVLCTTGVIND